MSDIHDHDEEVLRLNPDQQKYLADQLRTAGFALHTAHKSITEDGALSTDLLKTVIANVEFALSDISKVTGVRSESANEIEQRFAEIRAANERIRALEQQLGAQASASTSQHALGVLHENIDHWWDKFGFGYVSEVQFGKYGCELKLSCVPSGLGLRSSYSETPVTDEESYQAWLSDLQARGFSLTFAGGKRDPEVLDTPQAREIVFNMLRGHLPSSKVQGIGVVVNRNGECVLRDIKVYVRDLEDLAKLADRLQDRPNEASSERPRPAG